MTNRLRLATLTQDHWALANGVTMHAEFPETFEIPAPAETQSLKPGDLVKLVFKPEQPEGACTGERMWVQVTRISEPYLVGRLDNHPFTLSAWLHVGSQVVFLREHVIDIDQPVSP
jgi:hypothetical protein